MMLEEYCELVLWDWIIIRSVVFLSHYMNAPKVSRSIGVENVEPNKTIEICYIAKNVHLTLIAKEELELVNDQLDQYECNTHQR